MAEIERGRKKRRSEKEVRREGAEKRRKGEEIKKKRMIEVKKVAEEQEIWNEEKEAAKSKEEAKKLVPQRFYKWIKVFGKKESERISTKKLQDHTIEVKKEFVPKMSELQKLDLVLFFF